MRVSKYLFVSCGSFLTLQTFCVKNWGLVGMNSEFGDGNFNR